jgi:hypothetical protein
MEGWVKIHRRLSENPLWTCEPFSRGQAWVDLILIANHADSFFYKRGVMLEVKRGQVGVSEVGLSDRWKWSRTKIRKFLNDLEKEQQIIQQKSNVTQLITIVNYDSYQQKEQQKDSRKTAERHKQECKEEKEINNIAQRQDDFKVEVESFTEKYSIELLKSFYVYWSEPNKSNTKMRKELEKTWDTARRLVTWKSNQEAWKRK